MISEHGEPGALLYLEDERQSAARWKARSLAAYLQGTSALEGQGVPRELVQSAEDDYYRELVGDAETMESVLEEWRNRKVEGTE